MNINKPQQYNMARYCLFLFIFLSVFVFFGVIHPTTVITGDEWFNLALGRGAYPEWNGFNPIKVVPEISFPLLSNIASSILMPLGFTFLQSLTYFTALLISLMVVIFLYQFFLLITKELTYSSYTGCVLTLFFLLCMFGLFRTLNNNNSTYMLWEQNITCYYHYFLPAVMNGTFSLYLVRKGINVNIIFEKKPIKAGFLFLIAYLCIFSNIFSNIILSITCGSLILLELISNKFNIKSTFKNHWFHLLIIIVWIISAIFESNGGRAERMAKGQLEIINSFNSALSLSSQTDFIFLAVLVIGFVTSVVALGVKSKNAQRSSHIFYVSVITGLLSFIAIILICAKSSSGYAAKPVVMWGVIMNIIICASIGIGYLMRFKFVNYFVPVVLLMLINVATNQNHSLKEPQNGNLPYAIANLVSQDMIDQVKAAVDADKRTMTLFVPKCSGEQNWPIPITRGREISATLKSNGVIRNNIHIDIQPDINVNRRLGVPVF